jgi:hypothetical protein
MPRRFNDIGDLTRISGNGHPADIGKFSLARDPDDHRHAVDVGKRFPGSREAAILAGIMTSMGSWPCFIVVPIPVIELRVAKSLTATITNGVATKLQKT